MKWKTGLTGLILFLLMNTATGPDHRDECKNVRLICSESRDAAVGEAVTLDYHFESQCDVKDKSIVWKFNNNDQVLVYKSRNFSPIDQADRFKGRASEDSSWKPTEGKLALKISPVKITDAGTYNCSVRPGSYNRSCSTKLNIKQQVEEEGKKGEQAQGKTDSLPKQSEGDLTKSAGLSIGAKIGIGSGAVIVIVICSWIWKKYKKARRARASTSTTHDPTPEPAPEAGPAPEPAPAPLPAPAPEPAPETLPAPAPEPAPTPLPAPAPEPEPEPEPEHDPRPSARRRGYTRQKSKETDNPEAIPLMNKGSTSDGRT